jgi:hypothetical protein
MPDLYLRLNYDEYKSLETQCREFDKNETSHTSVEGYYHKAFRLRIADTLLIEFQGPLVMESRRD